MKKTSLLLWALALCPLFSFIPANRVTDAPAEEMATVYIYRAGQFYGASINYVIEANGQKICRLSNNKYIEHKVAPGKYTYAAKRGGVEVFKRETDLAIDVKAGEKHYVRCDIKSSITRTRLEMAEVMPSTGERDLAKLKPDTCNETESAEAESKKK